MEEDTPDLREELFDAVLGTRFPVLILGSIGVLTGALGGVVVVLTLASMLSAYTAFGGSPGVPGVMVVSILMNIAFLCAYLFAAGLLLHSGILGLLARHDRSKIPMMLHRQTQFWQVGLALCAVMLVLWVVAMCGGL